MRPVGDDLERAGRGWRGRRGRWRSEGRRGGRRGQKGGEGVNENEVRRCWSDEGDDGGDSGVRSRRRGERRERRRMLEAREAKRRWRFAGDLVESPRYCCLELFLLTELNYRTLTTNGRSSFSGCKNWRCCWLDYWLLQLAMKIWLLDCQIPLSITWKEIAHFALSFNKTRSLTGEETSSTT